MKFIAFDTETTGLNPNNDKIIEIGAVRFSDGKLEARFSTLINPGCEIPQESINIHKITNECVKNKHTIDKILPSFSEFCQDTTLVAHNANFDFQFLMAAYKEHKMPAPEGEVLDTLALSRKIFPGLINYKLGTLVKFLNIPANKFHRAEDDALYCAQVFQKMLEKMGPPYQTQLQNLVKISGKRPLRFPVIQGNFNQFSLL